MQDREQVGSSRPVESTDLEIAGTFQDAGTRPIEESPNSLVSDCSDADELKKSNNISRDLSNGQNKINSVPPLD